MFAGSYTSCMRLVGPTSLVKFNLAIWTESVSRSVVSVEFGLVRTQRDANIKKFSLDSLSIIRIISYSSVGLVLRLGGFVSWRCPFCY